MHSSFKPAIHPRSHVTTLAAFWLFSQIKSSRRSPLVNRGLQCRQRHLHLIYSLGGSLAASQRHFRKGEAGKIRRAFALIGGFMRAENGQCLDEPPDMTAVLRGGWGWAVDQLLNFDFSPK